MDQDIQSQLDRAKELLQELEKTCNNDLQAKNVSGKTKNLSQEILSKVRNLLDQAMYKFFDKYYFNNLSNSEKKYTKIYFPIASKKDDLKSFLGKAKMADLETIHHDFYQYLDSIQPYNQDYLWLSHLRNFSNEKHIRLTPQTIKEENETKLGNAIHVGRGAGVSMYSCFINDIPVDSKDINKEPLENFDPRLGVQRITWVSFVFSGTDINILQLCKKSIEDGEKIIKNILEFV